MCLFNKIHSTIILHVLKRLIKPKPEYVRRKGLKCTNLLLIIKLKSFKPGCLKAMSQKAFIFECLNLWFCTAVSDQNSIS